MAVFEQKKSTKVTLDDTVPLTCVIETAQNVKDHTDYLIRVQRGPVAETHWYVTKRYSDFATLDAALHMAGIDLPLPPKKVFGKMEREFIAERQQGLQMYLKSILDHPLLASCLLVKRFLDPNNYSTNLQEVALQHISMFFRSEPRWEVVEPAPDIGWRYRKQYFMIKDKNEPKTKFILSWSHLGPDHFLSDKDLVYLISLLTTIQHPHIYPVAFAMSNDTSGIVITTFKESGSMRDVICRVKPRAACLRKYGPRKGVGVVQMRDIQLFGRQILETLKFLHEKGLPYGHLHAGNIMVEDNKCRLVGLQNWMLGLPSVYRPFITGFRKIQTTEAIDVYSFGQLLYEMCIGEPLNAATCDNFPSHCPPELRSVMESILTTEACKNKLPSVSDLLSHPLFANVVLPASEKPVLKIPSKMKEALREAKASMERRLKDEQKMLGQARRISKATAFHMSEDEKKKRRKTKKKQLTEQNLVTANGDVSTDNPSSNQAPSSTSPASPSNEDDPPLSSAEPPPPGPPPLPAMTSLDADVPSTPTSGNGERAALLTSISSFSKTGLKRAETVDKSGPRI